jgi:hypothetical protein
MRRRQFVLREAMAIALSLGAASAASAADLEVTALRTDPVRLYNCEKPTDEPRNFPKKDFKGPWKAAVVPTAPAGFLQVLVGDTPYCVRAYSVQTNRPIPITAECERTRQAREEQKIAATRNVGEGCR